MKERFWLLARCSPLSWWVKVAILVVWWGGSGDGVLNCGSCRVFDGALMYCNCRGETPGHNEHATDNIFVMADL